MPCLNGFETMQETLLSSPSRLVVRWWRESEKSAANCYLKHRKAEKRSHAYRK